MNGGVSDGVGGCCLELQLFLPLERRTMFSKNVFWGATSPLLPPGILGLGSGGQDPRRGRGDAGSKGDGDEGEGRGGRGGKGGDAPGELQGGAAAAAGSPHGVSRMSGAGEEDQAVHGSSAPPAAAAQTVPGPHKHSGFGIRRLGGPQCACAAPAVAVPLVLMLELEMQPGRALSIFSKRTARRGAGRASHSPGVPSPRMTARSQDCSGCPRRLCPPSWPPLALPNFGRSVRPRWGPLWSLLSSVPGDGWRQRCCRAGKAKARREAEAGARWEKAGFTSFSSDPLGAWLPPGWCQRGCQAAVWVGTTGSSGDGLGGAQERRTASHLTLLTSPLFEALESEAKTRGGPGLGLSLSSSVRTFPVPPRFWGDSEGWCSQTPRAKSVERGHHGCKVAWKDGTACNE